MRTALYIGGERLDLFQDDNIFIKNSVAKIEDITKVFTETSNSFSVPASDNNNRIFKHYYNASIVNSFDGRKLVLGAIYLDGLHYKTGNFKLNRVTEKGQKADSYSLDFYGLLTELKKITGKDKLSDLDFSGLDFTYNFENVRNRLTNDNLSNTDVLNTLLSYKRYIYDTNPDTNNTEFTRNLANNNTSNQSGMVYQDSSSSIKAIKIIEAIEQKYNLTFSRDFFGTGDFSFLYLLLNGGSLERVFSEFLFSRSQGEIVEISYIDFSVVVPNDKVYKIAVYKNNKQISVKENLTGTNNILINAVDVNYNFSGLKYEISSSIPVQFSSVISMTGFNNNDETISIKTNKGLGVINSNFSVSENLPDITILEFLKGIFKMFKLVVLPNSENNLFVDTYKNYYASGKNRDITEFIDFTEVHISGGKLLNEISYKFQESETIIAKQFKKQTGSFYGDLELKITDESGELIEGESLSFDLPFENMAYEKITDINRLQNSNVVYGLMADSSLNAVKIKPHLHYIITKELNSNVKILDDSSQRQIISSLCMPSHKRANNSTTFGEEIDEHTGQIISKTLYSNFHKDFIESVFNKNKRFYTYTAKNVSLDLIINLKLNDNIIVKGRAHRIDSFDTNITTKEIKFNLINL